MELHCRPGIAVIAKDLHTHKREREREREALASAGDSEIYYNHASSNHRTGLPSGDKEENIFLLKTAGLI